MIPPFGGRRGQKELELVPSGCGIAFLGRKLPRNVRRQRVAVPTPQAEKVGLGTSYLGRGGERILFARRLRL